MPMFAVILTVLMGLVFWLDATRFTIPNWLNATVLALYPVMLALTPEDVNWLYGLYAFAAVLAIGFAIFAMNWMGGGDIKLLCALGLWVGWGETLIAFILYTAILGGVLSVLLILGRKVAPWLSLKLGLKTIPRVMSLGEPVPYGLAIGAAFLILLWQGKVPGVEW